MALRISGNRPLKTLPGSTTRPTTAKVREAVFNRWQGSIAGSSWLDLCAGTGSIGAEALCRGAARVVGIEQWGKACGVIQANWQGLASADQTIEVIRGDVVRWLPKLQGPFDFIYFDPPYQSGLYGSVVGSIATLALLHPQGELAIEHDPKYPISVPTSLTVCRHKIYGNTALTLLQVGT